MKLGDKCVLPGHDGCVVTGLKQTIEGEFVRVKTTQNEDWHPIGVVADSAKVVEVVKPEKKSKVKLDPMKSDGIVA